MPRTTPSLVTNFTTAEAQTLETGWNLSPAEDSAVSHQLRASSSGRPTTLTRPGGAQDTTRPGFATRTGTHAGESARREDATRPAPKPQNTQVQTREDVSKLQSRNAGYRRRPDERAAGTALPGRATLAARAGGVRGHAGLLQVASSSACVAGRGATWKPCSVSPARLRLTSHPCPSGPTQHASPASLSSTTPEVTCPTRPSVCARPG